MRLFKIIFVINLILITAFVSMWATWHVFDGGQLINKKWAQRLITIATLPTKLRHATSTNRLVPADKDDSITLYSIPLKILVPGFHNEEEQKVSLIDLQTNKEEKRWIISNKELNEQIDTYQDVPEETESILHPLLLKDSSIIFTYLGLMKLTKDNKLIRLSIKYQFHHTIEQENDSIIWVCASQKNQSLKKDSTVVEDYIVSYDLYKHKIEHEKPIRSILTDNGYLSLFRAGGISPKDRFHINDIEPVKKDGTYWKKGDVFVSLRNLSVLFLYRPSTQKILWLKQGPWLMQHDVDVLNDSTISIFNNNVLLADDRFYPVTGHNSIMLYHMNSNSTETPYDRIFKQMKICTLTDGRYDFLPNGDLYVDNENSGELFIIDKQNMKAKYVDRFNEKYLKRLAWPRIILP